jgi:hypothetical protein
MSDHGESPTTKKGLPFWSTRYRPLLLNLRRKSDVCAPDAVGAAAHPRIGGEKTNALKMVAATHQEDLVIISPAYCRRFSTAASSHDCRTVAILPALAAGMFPPGSSHVNFLSGLPLGAMTVAGDASGPSRLFVVGASGARPMAERRSALPRMTSPSGPVAQKDRVS